MEKEVSTHPKKRITPQEYLELERKAEIKSEYLDGEMTVWRRRAITRHLDECPPCADGFVFEVELRRIVVSKCREEVPSSLRRKIAETLGIVSES